MNSRMKMATIAIALTGSVIVNADEIGHGIDDSFPLAHVPEQPAPEESTASFWQALLAWCGLEEEAD